MAKNSETGGAPADGAKVAEPGGGARLFFRVFAFLQVMFAALLFMAITQLNQSIMTRGLGLFGYRTDAASIIEIIDSCGRRIPTTPAETDRSSEERPRICVDPKKGPFVTVLATSPGGERLYLNVNGSQESDSGGSAARILFTEVRLRPGTNLLAVTTRPNSAAGIDRVNGWETVRTAFGRIARFPLGGGVAVDMPAAQVQPVIVGGWRTRAGAGLLIAGTPGTEVPVTGRDRDVKLGSDGFAVIAVGSLAPNIAILEPDRFRRSARFTRLPSGEIAAVAEACLPKDHTLVWWARAGFLSPREFITRLTGVELFPYGEKPVSVHNRIYATEQAYCTHVRATARFGGLAIDRDGGSFLGTPFDNLELTGFGNRIDVSESPASSAKGDSLSFAGGSGEHTLRVSTDSDLLSAELERKAAPKAQRQAPRSPLAAAWSQTEAGLPTWIRALLYGVSGVAPIILLILVIQARQEPATTDRRKEILSGLFALLLLALAVAAQPVLFQLFFRATERLDLWALIYERRADLRQNYLDPYSPLAIAVSVMLVPFLKSGTGPTGRSSALSAVWAVPSMIGAALLIAIALLQTLPWIDPAEKGWVLDRLASLDVSKTKIGIVTVVGLGAGLSMAWVPIYWAFRVIRPAGRFFRASLLAGAAAILLPLCAYLIEALRVAVFRPAVASWASGVSWVSLLGGLLLPFLLFFVLLRAFREILVTVAPETARPVLDRHGRTRNLLVATLLLVTPGLALEAVNPSPGQMGTLEILGIFRALGLAVAVFAAIGLLLDYSRARTGLHPTPLGAYELGADEIAILGALFAGCLCLWTSDPLAVLVALGAGWAAFRFIVIEQRVDLPPRPANDVLAKALVDYRQESALLASRRAAVENKFGRAEIDYSTLHQERCSLSEMEKQRAEGLGKSAGEAKRWLLEFGPGPTPLANGLRGAAAGLGFAAFLQLGFSILGTQSLAAVRGWADVARRAIVDPQYLIANVDIERHQRVAGQPHDLFSPDLLILLATLLNACFLWIVMGFLFGFTFHRIRGDDGFVKALVFLAGVAIAFCLSLVFTVAPGMQPIRFIPVAVFLLVTGIAVFDARSLASRNQSPTLLPSVYGFRTSLGYVSLIGAFATIEPILKLVKSFFPK